MHTLGKPIILSVLLLAFYLPAGAAPVPDVCPSGCTYDSIQTAITFAKPFAVIRVGNGTYNENIDFLGKAITVRSVNGSAYTTIDGGGSGSVVTFDNGEGPDSVLSGFTIRNGAGTDLGTGEYYGGGIICLNTSPTITGCIIRGNNVNRMGGGIYTINPATPTIENCTVSDNTAAWGGGGISSLGGIVIRNSTIRNNTSSGSTGGGLFAYDDLLLENSTVSGNTSWGQGGGIYTQPALGSVRIINTLITGNRTTGDSQRPGGGMSSYGEADPAVAIVNSTISGNYSADATGGLYIRDSSYQLVNSIIWGNSAALPYGEDLDTYCSMDVTQCKSLEKTVVSSDVGEAAGGLLPSEMGNIIVAPRFADPRPPDQAPTSEGDYHLLPSSPCIAAGTNDTTTWPDIPALDLDGDSRPRGSGIDMGADEYTGPWEDAVRFDGGWAWLDWFGFVNFDLYPWLYHENHGYLYPFGTSTDSLVFWDNAMLAFWWTSDTVYPYLYRFPDSAWLWYSSGTTPGRWFNNLTWGGWEQW